MSSKILHRLAVIFLTIIFAAILTSVLFVTNQALAREQGPDSVAGAKAQLRFAHLAPFDSVPADTAVDVKLDGNAFLTAIQYLSSTTYIEVAEGQHLVEVFPTGSVTPLVTSTITLTKNEDFTLVAHGGVFDYPPVLTTLLDDNQPPPPDDSAWVRFGHLAPFASVLTDTEAEIRTDSGDFVAGPFRYKDIDANYLAFAPGEYDLEVTSVGGAKILIDLAPFTLNEDEILYALAVGDGANQDPGVFAYPTNLEGYLLATETEFANLRVAHLAPFTDTLSATGVDVKLDGTQILTDFQYLSSTIYMEVPEGQQLVEIFPSGSMTPAVTANVDLNKDEDYTAIAHGGANGYSLTLEARPDDNSAPASGEGKIRFGHLAPFDEELANTAADIRHDDGTVIVSGVLYGDIANIYMSLPTGEYDLEIALAGTDEILVDLAPFSLNDGDILYALAVGDGANQDPGVFAYPTGELGFLLEEEIKFAQLRVAHLAPFSDTLSATGVDVKLDGTQVLTDVQYLDSTTYITVTEGQYLVEVLPTGTSTVAISATVSLDENEDYTAIAHGGANNYPLTLAALLDDNSAPASGEGKIRFGHLAPFDPVLADTAADIRLDDGTVILDGVLYGDIKSTYLSLPAGEYDLEIALAGTDVVIIDLAPITLNEGDILYALAVGDGTNQDPRVFAYFTDEVGFLLPTEQDANLRVVHLAPFASDLAATGVDVKLDGTQVLTDVQYLDSTTYLDLPIGDYLVEIFLTGTDDLAISAVVNLAEDEDYTAIAQGGANDYDLELVALVDDNSEPDPGKGKVRFGHLAPFAEDREDTEAEIRTDDGDLVAGSFRYGDIDSIYLELDAGEYNLAVVSEGSGEVLIDLAPFALNEGDILYALAVGDGANQDLGVFAYPTDLEGFLLPLATKFANLRVAHLAPFTDTLSATGVDVKLNGTQILTDFQYLSSTTYLELPVGEYLVEIFPTGTMTPVISEVINLEEGEDYTAIAHGGANGYDLELVAKLDDNSEPDSDEGNVRFGHLAPFDPILANTEAEIRTDRGKLIAGPFLYGTIDEVYVDLDDGKYDLEVTSVGGDEIFIDLAPFILEEGKILYALVVGDGTNQDLGVFAYPTDEEGFLLDTEIEYANLRVAHLAPFSDTLSATAVDVKLDGTQVLTAVQYLSSTTYMEVVEGQYLAEIFPTGTMTPVISEVINLEEDEDYTAIAHGGANDYDLELVALEDDNSRPDSDEGNVRFGHLAPFDPIRANTEAEIRTDDGELVAGPFLYGEINSRYLELDAGVYDLEVTSVGGAEIFIDLAPFTLEERDILYVLVVGDGTNQALGVFAYPTDLEGFLLDTEIEYADLRVAHLAPFDSVLADTAVDVKLDGTQVLTAVQYLSSTTYMEVVEGQYLVEVFPTGTDVLAISALINLEEDEDYTAIAHGGASDYDLELVALLDDNDAPASGKGKVRFGHLAPFAADLDDTEAEIRTDDGDLVAGPFLYGEIAELYAELDAGEYDLEVTSVGGAEIFIDLAPFTLEEGAILYALAVGDGANQDLGVFAYPTDLEGFLLITEIEYADLRVAHLAPFDSVLANTAVDVKLDGDQVLTAVQYLSSTTYMEVVEGQYLVEIFPTGTDDLAISALINLEEDEDYTAIAHGGANEYDLALVALLDDNSDPDAGEGKVRFGHLAPFAADLDDTEAEIRTDDGDLVAGPFLYGEIAELYAELDAGEYDLEVTSVGGAEIFIDLAPFTLNEGDILYALAVGDGTNQDLGVFAYPTDLEGFLLDIEIEYADLRVAHLAPFDSVLADTAVDVKLDGELVLTAVQYLSSTTYMEVVEGQYLVEIFPTGTDDLAISALINLEEDEDYTAIAQGGASDYDLELVALLDDNSDPDAGEGKVRFGHLAPFASEPEDTEAEIRTDDGELVAGPFLYGDIEEVYAALDAGEYDLEVTSVGGDEIFIDLAPFTLNEGDILYALAVGDGSNQDLGVFAYPTDLEGFLLDTEIDFANLRVAHLAPFDSVLANTAVDVKLDGAQVLTAVQYLSSTTYMEVPEGQHLVEVFPTGTSIVAISATVSLDEYEDYTAIAQGDAGGYDLELVALLDDNSEPDTGEGKIRFGHLAPFAGELDDTEAEIRTDDGELVAGPFLYGEIEEVYAELDAGEYDLEVTSVGGAEIFIDLAPFTLNEGAILYALAVGDGSNQELGVFAYPTDLEGFLLDIEIEYADLRVAHLAPFDSVLADTAVDVKLDGAQVLTAVQYLSSTTYMKVVEGQYLVEVFPTGTDVLAVSALINLEEDEEYTAIAHGSANDYALELVALLDDNNAPASGKGKVRFGHLAPFAAELDDTAAEIRTDDGDLVAGPFLYGEIEELYAELDAGEYDLEVTSVGGAEIFIDLAPFTLEEGAILYALAVGDGTNQDLGVFAYPTDLEGFLLPQEVDLANLRVAHLAPFDSVLANTGVDVKLDGTQVLTDFQYLNSTTYIEVLEGQYLVEIFPTGTSTPAVTATIDMVKDGDYTAIAYGGAKGYDLELVALVDDNSDPPTGFGKVRLGHLAPFDEELANTAADVRYDDGTVIVSGVLYGQIADTYLPLPAGEYDLEITLAGTDEILIDLAPLTLKDGDILYALAVGDGANQDLGVFAYPTDLEGFLLPQETEFANLRVAHLAPFDSVLAATGVDVKLDGTQVLTDVQYLDSTTYAEVIEGQYLVEIFPTGSSTPAISASVSLGAMKDYTVIAHGGANGYDLALQALLDDNDAPASGMGKVRFGHLAPFDPDLNDTEAEIRTDNGTVVAGPFLYGEIEELYAELDAGVYDLKVVATSDGATLINLAPFTLNEGDILYALAVGDGANQDLGVFAYPTDLQGFLLPQEALYKLFLPIILK